MKKFIYLLTLLRSPRRFFRGLTYLVNDEFYWDAYVKNWEMSSENRKFKYLGEEWGNQEVFVELLRKHSDRNASVLEIGCGGGKITAEAAPLFKHVSAADVSSEMLRKCKEAFGSAVSYHKLNGFTLTEFKDGSLDLVFSHDTFVHFSSLQVYPYLTEIKRVLKDGGITVISFYNFLRHFDLFKEMSMSFFRVKRYPPHMRVHFVTQEMIERMASDLGMKVLEVERKNFLIFVIQKR